MNAETTGKFISELRKENGLTQAELANKVHVSDKAISRWETGKGFPDIGNLEVLSEALGVSIAELMKGERIADPAAAETIEEITSGGMELVRSTLSKRRIINLLTGFLASLVIVILAIVHLTSPIYIKDAGDALTLDKLSDGSMVAILDEDVAGYEISSFIKDPDTGEVDVFLSCYQTWWNQLTGKKNNTVAVIGRSDQFDNIYYYPTTGEDQLIYSTGETGRSGGVVTLRRLVYNYYILLGAVAGIAGLAIYGLLRKKYYAERILKVAMIPVLFTVSTVLCLIGHFSEVYNAAFYLSGILLLTVVLYCLFLMALSRTRKRAA